MILVFSENRIEQLIRNQFNIRESQMSADELQLHFDRYAEQLFAAVRSDFGLQMVGQVGTQASLASFRFQIIPQGTDPLQAVIAGAQHLNAVSITLEPDDMAAVPDKMAGDTLRRNWNVVGKEFHRMLPGEAYEKVEKVALRTMFPPGRDTDMEWKPVTATFDPQSGEWVPQSQLVRSATAEVDEVMFQQFLSDVGRQDPLKSQRQREAIAELQRREYAEQETRRHKPIEDTDSSSWGFREM